MAFPRLSQRQLISAALALTLVVAVVLVLLLTRSGTGGGNAADPALAKTAVKVLRLLNKPSRLLPVDDTTLHSFQAWFYDLRPPFESALKLRAANQLLEVTVEDPNTFPPQAPTLTMPGQSAIYVDAATAQKLKQSGRPAYTSVRTGGSNYRIYVEPLKPPAILASAGMTGMLLVIKQI